MKNTDTFAGFGHCINSYLAGVALAERHGVGLIHRPQGMAHGLGFIFTDFLDADPRGIIPPVYAPTLQANGSTMLVNGRATRLYVQLAVPKAAVTADKDVTGKELDALPTDALLWMRQGRSAFHEGPVKRCPSNGEACFTALWFRERFWRAVLRVQRGQPGGGRQFVAPTTRGGGKGKRAKGGNLTMPANAVFAAPAAAAADGGPIRVCVHVRRGDVYYLGAKTRMPHPHWVDTVTVLDILAGVGRAMEMPLEEPAVLVDVFSEVGWKHNDTAALRAIAPNAQIHLDSSPAATLRVMAQMAQADILVMGSSGFSFWAGLFSCGVKVGSFRNAGTKVEHAKLPMRFVEYQNTITLRKGPFWPEAGKALREVWSEYYGCRRSPSCRPSLCAPRHLLAANEGGAPWTESSMAKRMLADTNAVQWRLPELVLFPEETKIALQANEAIRDESPALSELRAECIKSTAAKAEAKAAKDVARGKGLTKVVATELYAPNVAALAAATKGEVIRQPLTPHRPGQGLTGCMRNMWLHNLTQFLAARKKIPGGATTVG